MKRITATIKKPEQKLILSSDWVSVIFYLINYKAFFIQVNQAKTKYLSFSLCQIV